MNRRTFNLAILAAAALPDLTRLWPFEEVDYSTKPDACCDWCLRDTIDLILEYDNLPKFYRTTDGHGLIVCEHCTGSYLRENA